MVAELESLLVLASFFEPLEAAAAALLSAPEPVAAESAAEALELAPEEAADEAAELVTMPVKLFEHKMI